MLDVSDEEKASHMIVVGEGFCRVEESPFLEVEKPTMLNLQLMGGGVGWWRGCPTDPSVRPVLECRIGKCSEHLKTLSLGSKGRLSTFGVSKSNPT